VETIVVQAARLHGQPCRRAACTTNCAGFQRRSVLRNVVERVIRLGMQQRLARFRADARGGQVVNVAFLQPRPPHSRTLLRSGPTATRRDLRRGGIKPRDCRTLRLVDVSERLQRIGFGLGPRSRDRPAA